MNCLHAHRLQAEREPPVLALQRVVRRHPVAHFSLIGEGTDGVPGESLDGPMERFFASYEAVASIDRARREPGIS